MQTEENWDALTPCRCCGMGFYNYYGTTSRCRICRNADYLPERHAKHHERRGVPVPS